MSGRPSATIVFDFAHNAVIQAGANADADRRYQEFIAQQQAQSSSSRRS
jgi:hypothetical protein